MLQLCVGEKGIATLRQLRSLRRLYTSYSSPGRTRCRKNVGVVCQRLERREEGGWKREEEEQEDGMERMEGGKGEREGEEGEEDREEGVKERGSNVARKKVIRGGNLVIACEVGSYEKVGVGRGAGM
eukprot:TRINITY_DN9717_c0_g1_i2.p1 TRINITY_DN9717_c0_g1~~TRINITY_DN9717_c0_g1_i2.p1  ORF type:complete len:127 (-),score=28.77 TRINITY_DN9717_c0_g1_i2:170-550(-)